MQIKIVTAFLLLGSCPVNGTEAVWTDGWENGDTVFAAISGASAVSVLIFSCPYSHFFCKWTFVDGYHQMLDKKCAKVNHDAVAFADLDSKVSVTTCEKAALNQNIEYFQYNPKTKIDTEKCHFCDNNVDGGQVIIDVKDKKVEFWAYKKGKVRNWWVLGPSIAVLFFSLILWGCLSVPGFADVMELLEALSGN